MKMKGFDPMAPENLGKTWWRVMLRDRTNGRKFHISVLAVSNDEATRSLANLFVGIGEKQASLYSMWEWLGTEPDYQLREETGVLV
jgi:hypothetical protein